MKYLYSWDPATGVAECTIQDKGLSFTGVAHCHPDDEDFSSERTGCYIAETRAGITRMRHIRDHQLRPQLKALKNFYNNLKGRKYYNPEHPVINILIKEINDIANEIEALNQDIKLEQQYLADYIANKDIIYKKLRKANNQ